MLTTANHQAYIQLTANKNAVRIGLLRKAVDSRNVLSNAAFVRLVSPLMGGLGGEPQGSVIRFLTSPTRSVPPTRLDSGVRLYNLNESEQIMLNDALSHQETRVINQALKIFERKFSSEQISLSNPTSVKTYLQLRLGTLEHEEFHVLWLDVQNKLIACERLFTGTLTQTQVHPREVIKSALKHNAASAIFAHNHPTGVCQESQSDIILTKELKKILLQIEVRLLDHIIVTPLSASSMLEKGAIK
jgi:DNA repair protein RadC